MHFDTLLKKDYFNFNKYSEKGYFTTKSKTQINIKFSKISWYWYFITLFLKTVKIVQIEDIFLHVIVLIRETGCF